MTEKLLPLIKRYDELSCELTKPEVFNDAKLLGKLSKEQSDLEEIALSAKKYIDILRQIDENKALLDDKELGELAKDELKSLENTKETLESQITTNPQRS